MLVATFTGGSAGILQSGNIRIGNYRTGCCPINGIIDEIRIWDQALTPQQIALSAHSSVNWLPPVTNADFIPKGGTTLPLKFQLYQDETLVTTMQDSIFLEVRGPNESNFHCDFRLGEGVDNLRWNTDGSYYIANLKTEDGVWPAGDYTATVGGIVTGSITFGLSVDKGIGRGNSDK